MGLISFIINNKEIAELEELIPILWDKIKTLHSNKVKGKYIAYKDTPIGNAMLRNNYGYGKVIKPKYDLPDYLKEKMEAYMKENGIADGGRMVVIKNSDYNFLMMSLAEFANKSNRYIQLMHKANLHISTKMENIFKFYQQLVKDINGMYIYVVE